MEIIRKNMRICGIEKDTVRKVGRDSGEICG